MIKSEALSIKNNNISGVDGLRVLAMFWVFLFHAWEFAYKPVCEIDLLFFKFDLFSVFRYRLGIPLFMAICGFCLFYSVAGKHERVNEFNTGKFYLKRFMRITPGYYGAMVFLVLQPIVLVGGFKLLGIPANWQHFPDLWQWITHVLYIHTLFPETWGGINGPFWTLGTFAQLYLFFPIVVYLYSIMRWKVIPLLYLIGFAYVYCIPYLPLPESYMNSPVPSTFFLAFLPAFASGMAVAEIRARGGNLLNNNVLGNAFLFVTVLGYIIWPAEIIAPVGVWRTMYIAIMVFCVCMIAVNLNSIANSAFRNKIVGLLAPISFTVYMIHQQTVYYLGQACEKFIGVDSPYILLTILWVPGFIIVAVLSVFLYFIWEKPFYSRETRLDSLIPKLCRRFN